MQKIAIVGAGFSGLSLAVELYAHIRDVEITLFDPEGFNSGASKIATGLMHKYVGVQAKLSAFGQEAQNESLKLVGKAAKRLGHPLILSETILRIPNKPEQAEAFQHAASLYNDLKWMTAEDVHAIDANLPYSPALLIDPGYTIDVTSYLHGLALICQDHNIILEKRKIEDLKELKKFDKVILATGAADIPELNHLKIHPVKGQLLVLEWPQGLEPLPCSLIGSVYLTMSKDRKSVIVGATYEHKFYSLMPDPAFAKRELLPKACELYSPLKSAQLIEVRSGSRASMPSRMPFAGKIQENLYALVGMGSKGLLYHAYFANQLVKNL